MEQNKKYNLLFNGEILTNEFSRTDSRSGIFFASKNIFNQLLKNENLNIYFYCSISKLALLKQYIKKYDLNIEIINENTYTLRERTKYYFRNLKINCDKKKHPIKRIIASLSYALLSGISKVMEPFEQNFKLLKKLENIDFYYSPCKKTPRVIKRAQNILSCVFLYDTIPLLYPEYFCRFSSANWFYELFDSLNKNELYFTDSDSAKRDFLRFSKKITEKQVFTAHLAASERFVPIKDETKLKVVKAKYNIPEDKKYVFSLCTLEPRKNLIRAVKTFMYFIEKNKIHNMIFVLGGGHWEKFIEILENEIDNFDKYKNKIVRAGYIDDEDLPVLYSNAHWFVFTSQYEGFGLPPLEAMSCGCPVIASNSASLPEVVGDAGIQIDWDSDEQHIEAYEKYYFNEDIRTEYGQKGLIRAKTFSWEKCANIIIENLIKEKQERIKCQKQQ